MNLAFLRQRAALLERLRAFFQGRGFLEVETPLALPEAIPERHIEPTRLGELYLQASPELAMKRLLCAGSGPIVQVTRCFRDGELGTLHSPEFTMVEWYCPGDDLAAGMALLSELATSLLGCPPAVRTTYREAFVRHTGVDPHTATLEQLRAIVTERVLDAPHDALGDDRDEWLNLLLSRLVEPHLGAETPELLIHYPASQAALAETVVDAQGAEVAERFELYYRGVELANGYHELTDAAELRRRLVEANRGRVADGAGAIPLPESLLAAMEGPGLPPSCGVALGFDRLVMLATGARSIAEVMA